MEDKLENIDGLFRNRLENYSPEPPKEIWDNINSGINIEKSGFRNWWYAAASIIAITTVGLSLWLTNRDKDMIIAENDIIVNEEKTLTKTNVNKSDINNENILFNKSSKVVSNKENTFLTNDEQEIQKKTFKHNINNNIKNKINKDQNSFRQENVRNGNDLVLLSSIENKNLVYSKGNYSLNEKSYNRYSVPEQEVEKEKRSFLKTLSYGVQISPTLSYRNTGVSNIGSTETPLITSSGGIYAEGKLAKRLFIKTGFYYLQMGNYNNDIWGQKAISNYQKYPWSALSRADQVTIDYIIIDNSIGTIELNNVEDNSESDELLMVSNANQSQLYTNNGKNTYENMDALSANNIDNEIYEKLDAYAIQRLNNVEIPVILKYNLIQKNKIGVNLISGLSANIVVKNHTLIKFTDENKTYDGVTVMINRINLSGTFGIGIEYPVLSRMSIIVEPTFKYFLNSINIEGYAKIHPYTFGMYSGVKFLL